MAKAGTGVPPSQPNASDGVLAWTDARVSLLARLWKDGMSASRIAAELGGGVSRNAVIGKVHRLGLSGRARLQDPASETMATTPPAKAEPAPRSALPAPAAPAAAAPKPASPARTAARGATHATDATDATHADASRPAAKPRLATVDGETLATPVEPAAKTSPPAPPPAEAPARVQAAGIVARSSVRARGNAVLAAAPVIEAPAAGPVASAAPAGVPALGAAIQPAEIVVPLSQRVTIMELRENMCRWPLGDPTSPDFRYCGARTEPGVSYCPHHCGIAFQPSMERRRLR